jgi:hypothetical protein
VCVCTIFVYGGVCTVSAIRVRIYSFLLHMCGYIQPSCRLDSLGGPCYEGVDISDQMDGGKDVDRVRGMDIGKEAMQDI